MNDVENLENQKKSKKHYWLLLILFLLLASALIPVIVLSVNKHKQYSNGGNNSGLNGKSIQDIGYFEVSTIEPLSEEQIWDVIDGKLTKIGIDISDQKWDQLSLTCEETKKYSSQKENKLGFKVHKKITNWYLTWKNSDYKLLEMGNIWRKIEQTDLSNEIEENGKVYLSFSVMPNPDNVLMEIISKYNLMNVSDLRIKTINSPKLLTDKNNTVVFIISPIDSSEWYKKQLEVYVTIPVNNDYNI